MTTPDETPDQDLSLTALPHYLDVVVADVEGRLEILGAGDTTEQALVALRERLTGEGSVPVHALYHSWGLARSADSAELRQLIAEDPIALAFYTLGREAERVSVGREVGEERTRRVALESALTDVHELLARETHTEGDAAADALARIREVMPTLGAVPDDEPE